MSLIVYRTSQYINWRAKSGTFIEGGNININLLLSNYYTKTELQTSGSSSVHFDNITDAYHNNLLGLEGGAVADNSSGESSGEAGEYYHFDYYNWDRLMFLNFSISLTEDASNVVTLVNDESNPGNNMYYGTDLNGIKGWYGLPEDFLDSSGNPIEGAGITLSGSTNNTVCTVTGVDAIQGEDNLTYDGTDLTNAVGYMYADDFVLNSDRRLKTSIELYKPELLNIEYKQFELINHSNQLRYGVIAQDLQDKYPELVREDVNGSLSVSYIDLLVREIANLKDRVRELENG